MKADPQLNLRQRLREATRGAHDALDARVSTFDLSTRAGLRGFLAVQLQALTGPAHVSADAACEPVVSVLR